MTPSSVTQPLDALRQRRRRDRLAVGGAVVSLRQRGYCWADLADALGLVDHDEARRLAVEYLLAAAAHRGPAPRGADALQPSAGTHADK